MSIGLSTYHPLINVWLAISMHGVASDDDCAIVYHHVELHERRDEGQQGVIVKQLRTKLVVWSVFEMVIIVPLCRSTAFGVNVPAVGSYLT